jgi:hypothetical protein
MQQLFLLNGFVSKYVFTRPENTAMMEETFSTRSVPGCYKQDQLAVVVVGGGGGSGGVDGVCVGGGGLRRVETG